jgi:CheY-like chemotaxis protein
MELSHNSILLEKKTILKGKSDAKRKILIVDDDPDIVEAMRLVLESQNFEVHTAINGTECLRKIKETNPDLTILDVMMDELTEGFHVARRLKNAAPNSEYAPFSKIPILILTSLTKRGYINFSNEKDKEAMPVDAFLEKPVPPEILIENVRSLLNII